MKKLLILGLLLLPLTTHAAEIQEDSVYNQKKYEEDGKKDAKLFMQEYLQLDKPKYQRAYDAYKRDLEKISLNGRVPENEDLYQDLRQMNSNTPFIYKQTKRRGNLYKKYKY